MKNNTCTLFCTPYFKGCQYGVLGGEGDPGRGGEGAVGVDAPEGVPQGVCVEAFRALAAGAGEWVGLVDVRA